MKKNMLFVITLTLIVSLTVGFCSYAGVLWTNIAEASVTFKSSSVEGKVIGISGTTNITATLAVYKQNSTGGWDYVGHTGGATSSSYYVLSVSFTPVSGGYYKAVLNATVTANGMSENTIQTAYRTY